MNKKNIPGISSSGETGAGRPWWRSRASRLAAYAVAAVASVLVAVWAVFFRPYVSTDDARIAADIIRVSNRGATGLIEKVNVTEGDRVTAGTVLVELDRRAAEAYLKKARARAVYTAVELGRMESLASQNGVSRQQLDRARAEAQGAEGDLQLAGLAYEYTALKSPVNGTVIQKLAQSGNTLESNQTAVTVVDMDNAWVSANIEETYVGMVRPGQKVTVDIDEGGSITGKVAEVRRATTSTFALIPADSSSGNFIKLVQRIPVRILLDPHPGINLRVGQSVVVKIKVR